MIISAVSVKLKRPRDVMSRWYAGLALIESMWACCMGLSPACCLLKSSTTNGMSFGGSMQRLCELLSAALLWTGRCFTGEGIFASRRVNA
jgi:hypothetical protein